MSKLTDKMEMFCQEYIIDFNATRAAKSAGYSEKSAKQMGTENLSKPSIQTRIAQLVKKRSEKLEIDAEFVLNSFLTLYGKCSADQPVLDKDGNPTGEYRLDGAGANRAMENIGKHIGFYLKDNEQKKDDPREFVFHIPGFKSKDK